MKKGFRVFLVILAGIPLLVILLHTLVRLVRHFYKFPIPQFLANAIDNPLRRRVQPPHGIAERQGIQPGMRVLEVGPGNGTYTLAAARQVGPGGQLVTVDIEPKMIERVQRRLAQEGITNVEARVEDVYCLPFEDASFDLVYMISVIGEIPEPFRALAEFRRVLKPDGKLVFSELLLDPDYPLAAVLTRRAEMAGFRLKEKRGNFFSYTLILEKDPGWKGNKEEVVKANL